MRVLFSILLLGLLAGATCNLPDSNTDTGTPADGKGIHSLVPAGSPIPEIGVPVSVRIINHSDENATVLVRYLIGSIEVHRSELQVPANTTLPTIGPDLAAAVEITGNYDSGPPTPAALFILGLQFESGDTEDYIIPDRSVDDCSDDPDKKAPGICGCGNSDADSDNDGVPDCIDQCPQDPHKNAPGACGCDHPDTDANHNGTADCNDPPPSPPPIIDCNLNNVSDSQDIANGTSIDCNGNGVPDECETDCNQNGRHDSCDIANETSQDCNDNGIPDECETDCNHNGLLDTCDINNGTSEDCNKDGVPDECQLAELDCNENGRLDPCDILEGIVPSSETPGGDPTTTIAQELPPPKAGGPVIIGGDDADDHGSFDGTVNVRGWLYIEEGFNNIGPSVTNGNKTVVCLGAEPGLQAANGFESGFDHSHLPGFGWSRITLNGAQAVADFFNNVGDTHIANAGIIYLPTDSGNVVGGISSLEEAVLNSHANEINSFVASGGGFFSHDQSDIFNGFRWLFALLPGLTINEPDGCNIDELSLTADGSAAFPHLNDQIISNATPWHDWFSGDLGGLKVMITGNCDGVEQPVVIGGSQVIIQQGVTLEPTDSQQPVHTPHTLNAMLIDTNGKPVAGKEVTFQVLSGPNAGTKGTDTTGLDGTATFTYIGSTTEGTDHINATFLDGKTLCTSNEVTNLWKGSADCNNNGIPDECETDTDGDSLIDVCDNCPSIFNPDQRFNPCGD